MCGVIVSQLTLQCVYDTRCAIRLCRRQATGGDLTTTDLWGRYIT